MVKVRKNKDNIIDNKINNLNKSLNQLSIFNSLKDNIINIKTLFKDDDTLIAREFKNNDISCCLFYCQGLVNSELINENIIKQIIQYEHFNMDEDIISTLLNRVLTIDGIKRTSQMKEIIENVTYGDTILFVDNYDEALILNTKQFETRNIDEPNSEKVIVGPREGFIESLTINLSMIRRRLRTNDLKFKYMTIGKISNSQICICYLDSIVNKSALEELNKRLKKINIDGVVESQHIVEIIRDKKMSPFRSINYTERPDAVIGKILEGRIAIIIDGSPMVLTVPYLFIENFQNAEDYYMDFYYTSFARILRILSFILSAAVPAFYISIVAFHQEMVPTSLFLNIAYERQSVPMSAAIELFVMTIVFDILKEAGVRMSNNISQTLSIVGALVIGQAAVDARLITAPMVIVVSFTGITSLLTPKANTATILIRFSLLFLSAIMGIFGFFIGVSFVIIHILNLTSLTVPQTSISGNFKPQKLKDLIFRMPWTKMYTRPPLLTKNKKRMTTAGEQNEN